MVGSTTKGSFNIISRIVGLYWSNNDSTNIHQQLKTIFTCVLHIAAMRAFESIGVVYRDIGTSPLYVFAATFTYGFHHLDDILGALPLIIYFLTLFPFIKYVFNVLWANGDPKIIDSLRLICFCILIFGYKMIVNILHFGYKLIVNIYEMEGGKFALYSLICLHAKLSIIPNQQ